MQENDKRTEKLKLEIHCRGIRRSHQQIVTSENDDN